MSNLPCTAAEAAKPAMQAPSRATTVLITQKNCAWLWGSAGLEAKAPLKLGQKSHLTHSTSSLAGVCWLLNAEKP